MFGTSDSPATVLLGHETLIFEFSMSEIGGDQLLGQSPYRPRAEIPKAAEKPPIVRQNPRNDPPPPRENAHIYYYTPLPLNLANKQATSTSPFRFGHYSASSLRALLYSSHPRA